MRFTRGWRGRTLSAQAVTRSDPVNFWKSAKIGLGRCPSAISGAPCRISCAALRHHHLGAGRASRLPPRAQPETMRSLAYEWYCGRRRCADRRKNLRLLATKNYGLHINVRLCDRSHAEQRHSLLDRGLTRKPRCIRLLGHEDGRCCGNRARQPSKCCGPPLRTCALLWLLSVLLQAVLMAVSDG